eukprot:3404441-Rhodomonas_salina.1
MCIRDSVWRVLAWAGYVVHESCKMGGDAATFTLVATMQVPHLRSSSPTVLLSSSPPLLQSSSPP